MKQVNISNTGEITGITYFVVCSFFFCMKYFFFTSCNSLAILSISYLYSFTWDSYMFSSDAIDYKTTHTVHISPQWLIYMFVCIQSMTVIRLPRNYIYRQLKGLVYSCQPESYCTALFPKGSRFEPHNCPKN